MSTPTQDPIGGIWELYYEGNGLLQSVTVRANTGTFGVAQMFGETFEKILRDLDPQITLSIIHEIGPG